jgi:RNA polymerase-associated protein
MEIDTFRRGDGALAESLKARAAEQTAGMFAWLDAELGTRPWFNGERFGWADAAIMPRDLSGLLVHGFRRQYRDHRLE